MGALASRLTVAFSFRILGPLEVHEDGTALPLGTGRQRALLALLLVHANELVSSERLIDELWSGRPPPSAQKALQGYVSQLRRALTADTILTRGSGYVLVATDTDADEFERLTRLAAEQDADEAILTLQRALALWRGRAFEEFEYEEWAQLEIARLEELRLSATEQRIEAELELGHHAELVPELEKRVADHPLREQLRGQLMVALYRSGRHADALEVYRRGRQVLRDELGLEPSPFLAELERQILSHDATLRAPVRRRLPVGTVTFLFTDIEGSTRLLKQLGERYGDVLAEHQRILRDAVEQVRGTRGRQPGGLVLLRLCRRQVGTRSRRHRPARARRAPVAGRRAGTRAHGPPHGEPAVGGERYVGWACTGRRGSARPATAARSSSRTPRASWSRTRSAASPCAGSAPTGSRTSTDRSRCSSSTSTDSRPSSRRSTPSGSRSRAAAPTAAACRRGRRRARRRRRGGDRLHRRRRPAHKVLPNSVIRIDPKTLKATQVAQVGDAPDLVIASGGYLWVTNNILRDSAASGIRNAGDHTLTRVDPSTGETSSSVEGSHRAG